MVGQKNATYAEESAEVEVLHANLSKLQNLTKKIQGSMSRLDTSGQVVKDAIGPINSNTQQLQVTSRNIDRLNEAIERLRQPLDAKGREEGIIKAGPQNSGLPQYLAAIRRVEKAVTDLSSSNLRSNQAAITEFNDLLAIGTVQLHDLYRDSVSAHAQRVEPLHYITKGLAFPVLPAETISLLTQLSAVISSIEAQAARLGRKPEDFAAKAYADSRGQYMSTSLENLSTASIKTSRRNSTDAGVYREGTSGIGVYTSGIEGLCLAEHDNISRIFPPSDQGRVLSMTTQTALNQFTRTLKDLNSFVKSRVLSDCFLAFEILDIVTPMSYRLESRTGQLRPQFSEALRPVRETARVSLIEMLDQTKFRANNLATLPTDGNTIALVSDTATRLTALAKLDRPVSSLLSSLGDGNWRLSAQQNSSATSLPLSISAETENPTLLSHYMLDLVDALLTSVDAKSKAFHRASKSLQGVFLANSIAVLDRATRSSPDLGRYLLISPHGEKLAVWRKRASSLYLDAWRDPSAHLLDTIYTSGGGSGGGGKSGGGTRPVSGATVDSVVVVKNLSSKDKDKIKEKFKAFNASFDDMIARHKSLHMEREVRSSLSREVQAMIEPLYARFWDRYHDVDKGKGKCVKYDKGALASVLASLG